MLMDLSSLLLLGYEKYMIFFMDECKIFQFND